MDIWAWINEAESALRESGQGRLAELVDKLPEYTCDNRHAQVDAIYPEALALARASGRPWLEVFVRHWNLQSRILHRYEVANWMEEAVSLIEFAHRPDNRDCPQAVCVTQDLVSCYGNIDGPGYTEERLQATEETLARIDPSWPCWTCISSEHAEALIDDERHAEALAFAEAQIAAMTAVNAYHEPVPLSGVRIDALVELGRLDEAMTLAREASQYTIDRSHSQFRSLDLARLLSLQGRHEEAREALLPFETAAETQGQYESWTEVATRLALAGALDNDWRLDARLRQMQTSLVRHGIVRIAIEVATRRSRLAMARARPATASACGDEIEALLPRLRRPRGADEALATLRADIAALEVGGAVEFEFESAAAALEQCGEDPESDVERLRMARESWPDHEELLMREAHALRAMGRWRDAEASLRAFCAADPAAAEPFLLLGNTLLAMGETDAVATLAAGAIASDSEVAQASGYWLRAQGLRSAGDIAGARQALEALLELQPGAVNAAMVLAELEREAGEYDACLQRLNTLVESREDGGPYDWDLMVIATLLGRWDLVRRSAARVGFELEGEGPVEEDWGFCRVRFQLEEEQFTLFAQRTGPISARVVQMRAPGLTQLFRDAVVFEASPLNEAPEDDEAAETHTWEYSAIAAVAQGQYRVCAIDGAHPGAEAWTTFIDALEAEGCAVQMASSDDYEVVDPDTGEASPGVYAYVAAPPAVEDAALEALLTAQAEQFAVLVWPGLLEALGESERAEAQCEVAEAWGM